MSSIATCPQCAAQLAVPESASASDQARCPECRAEFLLAEGDLRFLSLATIVEPIESPPPAPTMPGLEVPAPVAELPEVALPETKPPEEPSPAAEPPQDMRSAETILSPDTLSGWEERLRTAIDSTKTEAADQPELAEPTVAKKHSLENSPEFEFEMDPPAESPADSYGSATTELPETRQWFETTPEQTSAEPQAPVGDEPTATDQAAAPPRRTKNSFPRRAAVVALFGTVGIVLGQYALLWLRGPSADYLHLAQFVPKSIFPSAQQQMLAPQIDAEEQLVSNEPGIEKPAIEQPAEELIAETPPVESEAVASVETPEVTRDDFVQPATAQLPEVKPAPRASLLPATNTSAAEFAQLLPAARESAQALVDGDLSTRESFRAMGHAYMALCQLAERMDFVHGTNLDGDARNQALSAQALFRALAKQPGTHDELALIASRWWQHQQRSNRGIFLVGRIQNTEAVGLNALCQMSVVHAGESTLIPVLLPAGSVFQAGDSIGVVGTIVAQPGTAIPGFTADLPQLAVAADSFSVATE